MSDPAHESRTEGQQNAVIHEGAPADREADTNERADDSADIRQPDGEKEVPRG